MKNKVELQLMALAVMT